MLPVSGQSRMNRSIPSDPFSAVAPHSKRSHKSTPRTINLVNHNPKPGMYTENPNPHNTLGETAIHIPSCRSDSVVSFSNSFWAEAASEPSSKDFGFKTKC